ncbi:MAG: carboxypeptidase-like regulatory domain-containing protein [Bryobacteraceae bacterium]
MNRVLLALFLGALSAFAQSTSLSGVVSDPTGAIIPDAIVTVTNQANSAARNVVTDGAGAYNVPQLAPGLYMVEAQRPGFATYKLSEPIRLQTATPTELNITMTLGQVSETINVVGEATQINTENASTGNPFVEVQIRQLPLLTRNVVQLLSLQAGVAPTGEVMGARRDQNNITLDGVDVNDNAQNGGDAAFNAALPVPLDSVQEFRTTTAGQGANQGRSSGGQVTLVTKSGSNAVHGTLYEFHRNKSTAANSWFSNRSGVARENLVRNQYGASLGGPIMKDKWFAFFNWEERKDRTAVSTTRTVPTESFKNGNIQFRTANGQIGTLTPSEVIAADPLHIGFNATVQQYLKAYPTGNDPAASADRGLNFSVLRFNAPKTLNNRALVGKMDFNPAKSGNHVLNVRGTLAANSEDTTLAQFPGQSASAKTLDNSRGVSVNYTAVLSPTVVNNFSFGLTRLGTASTGTTAAGITLFFANLNAFPRPSSRIAPTYNFVDDLTYINGRHTWQFGANMRFIRNSRITSSNFPAYSFGRATLKGLGQDITSNVNVISQAKYGSNVATAEEQNLQNAVGSMLGILNSYSATFQYNVDGSANPLGSMIPRTFATNEYEGYVMDTFKLRPDLTLTYGLRYGSYSPAYETKGQQIVPSIAPEQYFADRAGGQRTGISSLWNPSSRLTYVLGGPANNGPNWYNRDNNNFAPRMSVAYAPKYDGLLGAIVGGGTVIRAGGAVVFDRYGSNMVTAFSSGGSPGLATTVTQPLNTDFTDSPRLGVGGLPSLVAPVNNGFPYTPVDIFGGFNSFSTVARNLRAPYQYLLNASIARPLAAKMTLEVGYVGRLSHKSLVRSDYGQALTNFTDTKSGQTWIDATRQLRDIYENMIGRGMTVAQIRSSVAANPGQIPLIPFVENIFPGARNDKITGSASANYFNNIYGVYARSDLDALQDYDRVKRAGTGTCISVYGCNTFFGAQQSGLITWNNSGQGAYHGMQLVLRRAVQKGWGFDFNYTWSHALDNASASESNGGTIQDAFNPNGFRGPSDFDIRHNITANGVFQLPFGKDKMIGRNANKWLDGVIGGWQVTALVSFRTGTPVNLSDGGVYGVNYLNSSFAVLRPGATMPATASISTFNQNGQPALFSNTAAAKSFMGAYAGTVGTRGIIRGPNVRNTDLSIGKFFKMPFEGHTLQVRGEAFNAFNFVNFTNLQTSITSATFGQFSSTQDPRVMQFALRYEF